MYAVLTLHPLLYSCNFLFPFFGKKEVKELLVFLNKQDWWSENQLWDNVLFQSVIQQNI